MNVQDLSVHTIEPWEFRDHKGRVVEVTQRDIELAERLVVAHATQTSAKYRGVRVYNIEAELAVPVWCAWRKIRDQLSMHAYNNPPMVQGEEYVRIDGIPVPLEALHIKRAFKEAQDRYMAIRKGLTTSQCGALSSYRDGE